MAQGEFIEILSSDALASLKTANDEVTKLISNINKVGESMKAIKTPSQSDSATRKLQADYQKQEIALQKAQKALEKERLEDIKLAKAREVNMDKYNTMLAKENAMLEKNANLYNKIQAKVNAMIPEYNNLAARKSIGLDLTAKETIRYELLTARLKKYQNALKAIDADIGKHQREVGNYAKANSNLSNAIGQISRELPNFGQSFSIGVLSLTNNVGALIDSIKQVKTQNKALEADGKKTKSVFSQILSSVLSWQTALFIGIGIFSAYSREIGNFVSELFSGKQALDELTKAKQDFNSKRLDSGAKTNQEVQTLMNYIAIVKDTTKADEVRLAAFQKIKAVGGYYFQDLKQSEILTQKGTKAIEGFTNALEAQAKAQDYLAGNLETKKRIAQLQAEIDIREDYENTLRENYALINNTKTPKAVIEQLEKETEALKKNEKERRKKIKETEDLTLSEENSLLIKDEITKLENLQLTQRRSINKSLEDSILLDLKAEKTLKAKKERIALNFKEVTSEYELKKAILSRQLAQSSDKMENEDFDYETRIKARVEFSEKSIEILELEAKKEKAILTLKYTDDLAQNNLAYKNKLINAKQFNENILDINKRYNNEIARVDLDYSLKWNDLLNQNSAFYKKFQDDKLAQTENVNKLINEAEKSKFKRIYDEESKTLEVRQKAFDEYIKLSKKELEAEKIKELARAKSNEEVIAIYQKYKNLNAELDLIESPFVKARKEFEKYIDSLSSGQLEKALNDIGIASLKMFLDFDKNGESTFDKLFKMANTFGEQFAVVFQTVGDVVQETLGVIQEMSNAHFDNQLSRLAEQRDVAIAFAGDSATAREEIERQYDQRQRQLKRQQAKEQQKFALFNIAINTAQGIVSALASTPPNIPLSIAIGVIGAVQAGLVASTPIPEFYKGTENAPEGWAYTQEKGAEIITDKNGKVKSLGSNKGAELTYLNKGDKVFTAQESQMMFNNDLNNILVGNGIMMPKVEVNMDTQLITNEIKSLARTIANKESFTIVENDRGRKVYQRKQAETKELLNNVLTIKGYEV